MFSGLSRRVEKIQRQSQSLLWRLHRNRLPLRMVTPPFLLSAWNAGLSNFGRFRLLISERESADYSLAYLQDVAMWRLLVSLHGNRCEMMMLRRLKSLRRSRWQAAAWIMGAVCLRLSFEILALTVARQ
jgi:hypothetical protein